MIRPFPFTPTSEHLDVNEAEWNEIRPPGRNQPIQETLFNFDEHDTMREGFLSRGRVTRFRKSQRPSFSSILYNFSIPPIRLRLILYSQFLEYTYIVSKRSVEICKNGGREEEDRETIDRLERSLEGERLNAPPVPLASARLFLPAAPVSNRCRFNKCP